MRVLVCLESTNAATAVVDYLVAHGVDTESAENVDLARRMLLFRHYDALLCEAESVPLAGIAKHSDPRTRTVVLSTDVEEVPPHRSGVDTLLVKPQPLSRILGCLSA